jgi:hypothetical protein
MTIGGSFIDRARVRQVSVEPDTDGIGRTNIFAIETDDAVSFAQHKELPFAWLNPRQSTGQASTHNAQSMQLGSTPMCTDLTGGDCAMMSSAC